MIDEFTVLGSFEQALSHTKSKASEYEQLILASAPGKSLRWFRKDKNHLEKFDTYWKMIPWKTACPV